jgi:hypothetical protein
MALVARPTVAWWPPRSALTIDVAPIATDTRVTGTRYPSAASSPSPWTLPTASASTASVGLSVRIASGEKATSGTAGVGGASEGCRGPSRPLAARAARPASAARATGGTRRAPSARAAA